jgi:hypothetical protein
MKKLASILLAGGLWAAATAQAQVDIYVTGSTAFRANAYRSIRALYGAGLANQNPAHDASGQNQVTFQGTISSLFGAQTVTIRTSYNGSAAGVQALVQNQNLSFLTSATVGDTNLISHQADLAFSDVFQAATAFPSPALNDALVGVQPFVYVKSVTTPSSVTNITIQQLQSFLANGVMPLSYFSGNTNDDSSLLYCVGRDSGSGTRITAERDALFVGGPLLWAPDVSCNWNVSAGFSSGSGIAGVLNGTCGPAIGYLGMADAKTVASGANIMRYNGQPAFYGPVATPDWTPVYKGLYSMWGYEHLFRRGTAPANIQSFRTGLGTEINNDLATSTTAIQVGKMQVSRPADGGPISP